MKIALCLSGYPRVYPNCHESIRKKVIQHHDCDVFMHTWWDDSCENQVERFGSLSTFGSGDQAAALRRLWQPKRMLVEKPDNRFDAFPIPVNDKYMGPHGIHDPKIIRSIKIAQLSQYYSIRESYKLIENPDDYDIIVRCRSDLLFDGPVNFEFGLPAFGPDHLWLVNGTSIAGAGRDYGDWFAWGIPSLMDRFMTIYNRMSDLNKLGMRPFHEFLRDDLSGHPHLCIDYRCSFERPPNTIRTEDQIQSLETTPVWAK